MDPQTYCRRACTALLAEPAAGHEAMQRAAVLAHFAALPLSEPDFVRELRQLWRGATRDGRLELADAARAVLRDWAGWHLDVS